MKLLANRARNSYRKHWLTWLACLLSGKCHRFSSPAGRLPRRLSPTIWTVLAALDWIKTNVFNTFPIIIRYESHLQVWIMWTKLQQFHRPLLLVGIRSVTTSRQLILITKVTCVLFSSFPSFPSFPFFLFFFFFSFFSFFFHSFPSSPSPPSSSSSFCFTVLDNGVTFFLFE